MFVTKVYSITSSNGDGSVGTDHFTDEALAIRHYVNYELFEDEPFCDWASRSEIITDKEVSFSGDFFCNEEPEWGPYGQSDQITEAQHKEIANLIKKYTKKLPYPWSV